MSRSRSKTDVEDLKGIIRNLRSQNKNLRKQLSRSNKKLGQVENFLSEPEEEILEQIIEIKEEKKDRCPKCNSNQLERIEIGNRDIYTCDCGWRKSFKK